MKPSAPARSPRHAAQPFLDCLRQFLTPQAWKQAQQDCPKRRCSQRWSLQALVPVLLVLTWCCGDSLPERFETARAFYVAWHPKRRRPGRSVNGFPKAVAALPLAALRALAAGVRQQILAHFADCWHYHGFVPIGCDGARLACPRSAELEQRLGQAGKDDSAPMVWVTAVVHLRTGLLWAWRLGRGTASALLPRKQLIGVLPRLALLVADAGYLDHALYVALNEAQRLFLIRLSSRAYLYVTEEVPLKRWKEGLVS